MDLQLKFYRRKCYFAGGIPPLLLNMADIISPLKVKLALNCDYDDTLSSKLKIVHLNTWSDYDKDNGEQKLDAYNVINLKIQKAFTKKLNMSLEIDNVLNKTYALSNTYADLILLSDVTSGDLMFLNEPGRYVYANLKYKF